MPRRRKPSFILDEVILDISSLLFTPNLLPFKVCSSKCFYSITKNIFKNLLEIRRYFIYLSLLYGIKDNGIIKTLEITWKKNCSIRNTYFFSIKIVRITIQSITILNILFLVKLLNYLIQEVFEFLMSKLTFKCSSYQIYFFSLITSQ